MIAGEKVAEVKKGFHTTPEDLALLKEDLKTFGWKVKQIDNGSLQIYRSERAVELQKEGVKIEV